MSKGTHPVYTKRLDYTGTNVTTGAWVTLDASLPSDVRAIEVMDSSGKQVMLGYGPAGFEKNALQIFPSQTAQRHQVHLDAGMRLALKAIDASATTGAVLINGYI